MEDKKLNIYKVDFKYAETGFIPMVVAPTPEAAKMGAEKLLILQGLSESEVTGVTLVEDQKEEIGTLN